MLERPDDAFAEDADAFAALYAAYGGLVHGIASRIAKSRVIAEDICQSVFLKAWSNRKILRSESFRSWLLSVTKNAALDVVRKKCYQDTELADDIAPCTDSVAGDVLKRLAYSDVREAVAMLPFTQREPIEIAYFEGLTYDEVSSRLAVPLGTVKSRIRAGLLHLGRLIGDQNDVRDPPLAEPSVQSNASTSRTNQKVSPQILRSRAKRQRKPIRASEMKTNIPPNESLRMAAVRRYDILDTPPDGAFDNVTNLAARLFNVPISIVSIVDHDRIWFKSHYGVDVQQVPRDPGLCASAILQTQPWVITDAKMDPRTLANPLVAGELGLQFYAGIPLRTSDGYNLGTLCVIDKKARDFSDAEAATLRDLAAIVIDELELRLSARAKFRMEADLRDTLLEHQDKAQSLIQILQTSFLPSKMPHIAGVEVVGSYLPAHNGHFAGDFYDIFPIDGDRWGIAIGDISGKGPRAAARTALARYTIRTAAFYESSPSKVLAVLNEAMLIDDDEIGFCTACYATLNLEQGKHYRTLMLASAGHPLPISLNNSRPMGVAGDMIGVFSKPSFCDYSTQLLNGDGAVFYTDGVTEARVAEGFFGAERLSAIIRRERRRGPERLLGGIRKALSLKRVSQADDVALLAIRVVS